MTYLMSVILGAVQGVAEFLPISSSGHLTLLQHFFQVEEVDTLFKNNYDLFLRKNVIKRAF